MEDLKEAKNIEQKRIRTIMNYYTIPDEIRRRKTNLKAAEQRKDDAERAIAASEKSRTECRNRFQHDIAVLRYLVAGANKDFCLGMKLTADGNGRVLVQRDTWMLVKTLLQRCYAIL